MSMYSSIDSVLQDIIRMDRKKLVIFPFGEAGYITKQILNTKYNIKEEFIIDKEISKLNNEVKSLEYLEYINKNDYVYLVASANTDLEYLLISKGIHTKNIVNIFAPKSAVVVNAAIANVISEVKAKFILDIDSFVARNGNISRQLSLSYWNRTFKIDENIMLDTVKKDENIFFPIHDVVYNNIYDDSKCCNEIYDLAFIANWPMKNDCDSVIENILYFSDKVKNFMIVSKELSNLLNIVENNKIKNLGEFKITKFKYITYAVLKYK